MNCLNLVNGTQNNNIKMHKNKNKNGVPTHIQHTKEEWNEQKSGMNTCHGARTVHKIQKYEIPE